MLSGMIISRLIDREGFAHKHFVEAKLLFNLHKLKTHVQSAPTTELWNTGLEGGIGSTFGLHKTFSGNQRGLSYELAKSDFE